MREIIQFYFLFQFYPWKAMRATNKAVSATLARTINLFNSTQFFPPLRIFARNIKFDVKFNNIYCEYVSQANLHQTLTYTQFLWQRNWQVLCGMRSDENMLEDYMQHILNFNYDDPILFFFFITSLFLAATSSFTLMCYSITHIISF